MKCPFKPDKSPRSNQPDRKKGKRRPLRQRRCVRNLSGQMARKRFTEVRRRDDHRKPRFRQTGRQVGAAVVVLCVGQDIYLRGAASAVVVMVVIFIVTVVMDGFARSIAQHPDKMTAPVVVAGVDAEPHAREQVGGGHQQAEE